MSRTFNCGIGMVLVVDAAHVEEFSRLVKAEGETVYRIGELVRREEVAGEHSVEVLNMDEAWN